MFSLASAALLGLSASTLVSALPKPAADVVYEANPYQPLPRSYGAGQIPFRFPLSDGFPNSNADQIKDIQRRAHGTLPIAAPTPANATATPPSAEGLKNLQLIALNEIFEVAFFTSLIQNITYNVPGFECPEEISKSRLLDILSVIQAQEEIHALNANMALAANGVDPIQPCEYIFPTTDLKGAINLAATFTEVVLGTLADVQFIFAQNSDFGLVRAVGSVIGQEGEQTGFFRVFGKKEPSELPFLTASVRDFAFTALQANFVPNSCPNLNTINLTTFLPLTVVTPPVQGVDQDVTFSVDTSGLTGGYADGWQWTDSTTPSLALINSQNVPVVSPLKDVQVSGTTVTFKAFFPQDTNLMFGLTLAAVTKSAGPFASVDDVSLDAVFAPGLIVVD